MNKRLCICSTVICFFYSISSLTQNKIQGIVYDSHSVVLQDVSVVLVNSVNNKVVDYTYTDKGGSYQIDAKDIEQFQISFSHISHVSKSVEGKFSEIEKKLNIDAVLENKSIFFNEVIVQTKKPFVIRKDTISFKTNFFTDGTEQTVEALLKKIPGLQVDNEGTIKVGDQEIEKLMIDGDDLFERGYKILSKNMPAYPIEEVEILKNYSNNRLLKNIEKSNKVALNLKLDEKSKRVWFGNIETSLGNDNFYQVKGNLMNFGKSNKFYFLTNLNNLGIEATGDINHLIRPFRYNETASIGDDQQVSDLLSLPSSAHDFKKERINFNNAELYSFNSIFNPTDRTKIKTLGFFNLDKIDFYRNSTDFVKVNGISFINSENYHLRNKKRIAFGKIDFIHDFSKNTMLETVSKYNSGCFNDASNVVFNGVSSIESLQNQNTLFDQKINCTNKFTENKVFLLTGRFIDEKTPQHYCTNQFFYQNLFPDLMNVNKVKQSVQNQMQFAGIDVHLMDRKINRSLLELQLGNEYRKDKLISRFSLLDDEDLVEIPNSYQNNAEYLVNDLYLKGKYRYEIGVFSLIGKLDFHQLHGVLKNHENTIRQSPFFLCSNIGLDWEINKKNKLISSYSYNTVNAKILDVYSDFVLTGSRSFSKGAGGFNQLNASSFIINYQFGNWTDRFFAKTFIFYVKHHDFYSTNTLVTQNFVQYQKILNRNRDFLSINTQVDFFLKFISSNLKVDLAYATIKFKNIVNNSDLRLVTSSNYNCGLELRSGFKGVFNYHIGTKWSTNQVETIIRNSFSNNVSFLDLTFLFNNRLDLQIQTERYYFGSLETDNSYYFFYFDVRLKLIKDKLIFGLAGKNLFDTKVFRNISISDIGTSTIEYRLLPRCGLLKMEYRF